MMKRLIWVMMFLLLATSPTGALAQDQSPASQYMGGPVELATCTEQGWNYALRMYRPRKEILDGAWIFPKIEPVK